MARVVHCPFLAHHTLCAHYAFCQLCSGYTRIPCPKRRTPNPVPYPVPGLIFPFHSPLGGALHVKGSESPLEDLFPSDAFCSCVVLRVVQWGVVVAPVMAPVAHQPRFQIRRVPFLCPNALISILTRARGLLFFFVDPFHSLSHPLRLVSIPILSASIARRQKRKFTHRYRVGFYFHHLGWVGREYRLGTPRTSRYYCVGAGEG